MAQPVPFDAAEYLDDEETIAEYLTAPLEDTNPDVFLAAVRDVVRARGMAQLAKDAGLGGESLHKLLAPGVKLPYDTMLKLLHALGIVSYGTTSSCTGLKPLLASAAKELRQINRQAIPRIIAKTT